MRSARIEALRALAALGVLVGHVWLYSQGWSNSAYSHRLIEAGRYGVWLFLRAHGLLRALSGRPLVLVGVASYSLYLWHVPLLHWLDDGAAFGTAPLLLAGGALAIGVAAVSYLAVERPFLRLGRRWQSVDAAPVANRAAQPLTETVG